MSLKLRETAGPVLIDGHLMETANRRGHFVEMSICKGLILADLLDRCLTGEAEKGCSGGVKRKRPPLLAEVTA